MNEKAVLRLVPSSVSV